MDHPETPQPVIVGIDGSKAALCAAIWAVEEAAGRDATLRLVHVVDPGNDLDDEYANAHRVIHSAWAAVEAVGLPVKLESDVLQGNPMEMLAEASRSAELVCVGWKGRHDSGERMRGYTAADLARTAFSPVAIVRSHGSEGTSTPARWIIAVLDDSPSSHQVLEMTMGEALLRQASVLALTPWSAARHDLDGAEYGSVREQLRQLLDETDQEDTDVRIRATLMPEDLLDMLAQSPDTDQLVVVSTSRPELVEELIGPRARHVLRNTSSSLLILRHHEED